MWWFPVQPSHMANLKPSLFCFLIMMPTGYEPDLVRAQAVRGVGIFACNAFVALSVSKIVLRPGVITTVVEGNMSHNGSLGPNTEKFIRAWDLIIADSRYRSHDWVVKVDPDCVFFPERLRIHLRFQIPNGPIEALYVRNCPRDVGMIGSLEVFSRQAIELYGKEKALCHLRLHPGDSGEDGFMKACMDLINASSIEDFSLLIDGYCGKGTCKGNMNNVAFHPYKDIDKWFHCWGQVVFADHNKTIHTPLY